MANTIKTLWQHWEIRVAVLAFSFGFAPCVFLFLAMSAISKG